MLSMTTVFDVTKFLKILALISGDKKACTTPSKNKCVVSD
jgi:hypothetical protein